MALAEKVVAVLEKGNLVLSRPVSGGANVSLENNY
jgi:hypothetical protein